MRFLYFFVRLILFFQCFETEFSKNVEKKTKNATKIAILLPYEINKVNNFLRNKFNDPEFDIGNLATYNPETNDYVPESRNLK